MRRVLLAVALLVVAALSLCTIVEHDTPWYVAAGQLIWRTRSLPSVDPFSYTATKAWLNHEWLSELILFGVHRAGGFVALGGMVAVMTALTAGVVARRGLDGTAPLLLALLAYVLREAASPRAQLFSTLLFALTLVLVLEDDEASPTRLWACLPLQLLWTQLHGGNPTGVVLLGALWLCSPSRRRALVAAACALATVIGPYGARVHAHFLEAHAALPTIREWEPMTVALRGGSLSHWLSLSLFVLAALSIVLRARAGERVRLDALLIAVFSLVALRYVRFATEASLVAAAVLTPWLARARLALAPSVGAALALLAGLTLCGARTLGVGLAADRFPIEAVAWLRANAPPGPMLNSYNLGGYLLWARPEERVFVDGRAFTVYDEAVVTALPSIYADHARYAALEDRYGFRLAVLQRVGRGAGFASWLAQQPKWHVAHADAVALVLLRDP